LSGTTLRCCRAMPVSITGFGAASTWRLLDPRGVLIAHSHLDPPKARGPSPGPTWTVVEETSKGRRFPCSIDPNLQPLRHAKRAAKATESDRNWDWGYLQIGAQLAPGSNAERETACGGSALKRSWCWALLWQPWPAGGCPAWRMRRCWRYRQQEQFQNRRCAHELHRTL